MPEIEVQIIDGGPTVEITETTLDVELLFGPQGPQGNQGIQGPQGPQGPPGTAENTDYTHDQMTPSATWVVVHNLGYRPAGVHVTDSSGNDYEGEVTHNSVNQLTITFSAAFSGTAYVS